MDIHETLVNNLAQYDYFLKLYFFPYYYFIIKLTICQLQLKREMTANRPLSLQL